MGLATGTTNESLTKTSNKTGDKTKQTYQRGSHWHSDQLTFSGSSARGEERMEIDFVDPPTNDEHDPTHRISRRVLLVVVNAP